MRQMRIRKRTSDADNESVSNIPTIPVSSIIAEAPSISDMIDFAVPSTSTGKICEMKPVTSDPAGEMNVELEGSKVIEHQNTVLRESMHTPCSHLDELPFFKVIGRRIVDIKNLFQEVTSFKHLEIFNCKNQHLQIVNEVRYGFKSLFTIKCEMCKEFKKIATDGNSSALDINKAIVLGAISTGGGFAQIQEQFGYCNIPVMGSHFFQKIQNELAETIHELAWEVIEQAGKQEKMIALEKGHICKDTVPYITVVADGAWSKRSYKVNYDAASGVGIILGQETKKVLFLGIRNKYCCLCTRAETKQEHPEQHICFKNWDTPSTGMESDIIVEGFRKSIEMHGVKYLYLVGDGDSSVTKKLAEANPYHLLRNYCTRLRDLSQKKISSKKSVVDIKQRNVLNNNIKRLRSGIVAAIKHVNEENASISHGDKINLLKRDIYNGPSHIFGDHTKCSKYFCSGPKSANEINWVPTMKESGLFQDILFTAERVARNVESLILNMDNNIAESYNAVLAKFVGGKRINFTARRSYTTRCEAAAISYNIPTGEFPRIIHKKITQSSPGVYTKKIITARSKQAKWIKSKKILFPLTLKRKQKRSTPADSDYGLPSLDIDEDEYEARKKEFLESIEKTEKELEELQINTVGQSESLLWKEERMKRLTASLFGLICKQRLSTHCSAIVKSILYNPFQGNFATNWGKEHEKIAINLYEELNNTEVQECGFFVDIEKPFLGASPDGLIGERGLVEVKCPQIASNMTPKEATHKKILKFFEIVNDKLHLKTTHNYYFQVQGQLHITKREYCVFIVWTPLGMESEIRGEGITIDIGAGNVTYIPIGAPTEVPLLQRAFSKEDWVLLDAMGSGPTPACSGKFLTMHKRRRKKLTTRSLSEDHAILDDIHHGQVQKILDRCGKWAFNAFTLETVAGGRSLPVLCVHLFHWYGLLDYFQLDVVRVWKLFTLIEEGYHSTNPYHNSIHATDVTQAMHCFLQEAKIKQHVTPLEVMASLIGAVAHDLDHPGVNQHFLISTSNHLAILYQNMSVLENHHWRSAIGCLLESGLAEQLLPYRSELEQQIRDLILATDINRQQEFLSKFKQHLDQGSLDLRRPEHRQFIMQIALKCADISNPTRPWDISYKWSIKVCDEFFRQGEFERQLNLPVTSICDKQSTSVAKIQVGFFKFVVTPLFSEWHRFLKSPLSTHMMKILDENRRRWEAQESVEQAEETQTELSDAEAEISEEEEHTKRSSETPSIHDFIPPPPREIRRQSLAVPTLESLGVRRHSVPVNMEQSLPRTIYRRESLPTGRGIPFGRSPVSPQTESRASSGLREEDELLKYGSQSSDVSSNSPHHSSVEDQPERPLSAENLLPEPSITSMTSSAAVSRLSSILQGNSVATISKCLTRQQTFPPPQPYVRMRYMSATAEMSTCPETAHEGDSRSNSSHGSHENISNSNNIPQYTIPSIAVLSPNNGRPPDILVAEAPLPQKSSLSSNKRETESADKEKVCKMVKLSEPEQRYEKENVDPRRLPTTSLTRRRGSAPVSLPLSKPDENILPAGGGLIPSDSQSLRRGSVPIEIAHYRRLDDENVIEEPVINITPVETTRAFWQYQRRGSAPIDLPPMSRGGERRELLTRHTSLNGKSGRRKKQLRRRSSGGPETVCFPESHSEIISRLLLRRPENPDTLLARRRGSLPIEVLTVGHSVF